jgi:hypothetical protein
MRNRIINGAMVIDQRNAGAAVTVTGNPFTLDRWRAVNSASAKFTVQQTPSATETGYATRVNAGFTNYLACTSSSAYSIGSTDYFFLRQVVEGLNMADLAWGTANAKTITISFWAYSSLTGTFGGVLQNDGQNRSYPFSYTISSVNTWEYKTITIAGDQSGTWSTTNTGGMYVCFGLGVGSTYSTTAGTWTAGNYFGPTGAVSVVGTASATFYITGVQLEAGTTASPFEYRQYGTELNLCQRYYAKMGQGSAQYAAFGSGMYYGATNVNVFLKYPTTMRSSPTLSYGGNIIITSGGGGSNITAVNNTYMGLDSCLWQPSGASSTTVGYGTDLHGNGDTNAYVAFSAEL